MKRLVWTSIVTPVFCMLVACGGDDDNPGAFVDGGTDMADANPNAPDAVPAPPVSFVVVDTGLSECYAQSNTPTTCPAAGQPYYGQDSQYDTNPASYQHEADGTIVTDLNTGLMWERAHHATELTYSNAVAACTSATVGGYDDWRLPSIKELFSLSDFRGEVGGAFYLDAAYFDLAIPTDGDLTGSHAYDMMGQTWSSTVRPDDASRGHYFYNFLDGHIKSAPDNSMFEMFYRCVRGDIDAFANDLVDNGDGSVSDRATNLMWQTTNAEQSAGDSQFVWQDALSYCQDLTLAGHSDWRLPNVKELQSIVDYSRTEPSLDTSAFTHVQAAGTGAFFWSSTSMINYPDWATYVCFGPCLSETGNDIHGPGAQRADPKSDNGIDFSAGVGDQLDVVQIDNYVRCVR